MNIIGLWHTCIICSYASCQFSCTCLSVLRSVTLTIVLCHKFVGFQLHRIKIKIMIFVGKEILNVLDHKYMYVRTFKQSYAMNLLVLGCLFVFYFVNLYLIVYVKCWLLIQEKYRKELIEKTFRNKIW